MAASAFADLGWLVPSWPAPPGVHALCTTRQGGVSRPPYDGLNLGTHVGDDAGAVRSNRAALQARLQAVSPGTRPVFLSQVHGTDVLPIGPATPDGLQADACVTACSQTACTIMVADCLPVLLAHRSGAVVAAAHAGWRGLAGAGGQGVLESVFRRFEALAPATPAQSAIENTVARCESVASDTLAWLGPCIGPAAFEVGPEVRAAFCEGSPAAQACFMHSPGAAGKYLCDLAGLARLRLQALGVTAVYGNDGSAPWCTVSNPSIFFSHRRDSRALGGSGRFAACIWRDGARPGTGTGGDV